MAGIETSLARTAEAKDVAAPQRSVGASFNANAVVQNYAQPYGYPTTSPNTGDQLNFPVQIYQPDSRDKYYAAMPQVLQTLKKQAGSANVNYAAGPADVQYYADKADAQANGEFKSFLINHMDLSKPESAMYWKSVAPEIFQERLNIIASQHELSKRLAQINVVGPQDIEDYAIIWGIQTGRIQAPPEGALWKPKTYETWQKPKKSGMFATFLWGTKDSSDQNIPGGDYSYYAPAGSAARRPLPYGVYTANYVGGPPGNPVKPEGGAFKYESGYNYTYF